MTHGVGDQALSVEAIREILGTGFPDRFVTEQGLIAWAEAVHNGQYLLAEVIGAWTTGTVAPVVEGYTGGSGAAPGSGHAATVTNWRDPGYLVPDDFSNAIEASGGWVDRVTEWDFTEDERDLLMRHMYWRFTNGYGPDEVNPTNWKPGMSLDVFMGTGADADGDPVTDTVYNAVQGWLDSSELNLGGLITTHLVLGCFPRDG